MAVAAKQRGWCPWRGCRDAPHLLDLAQGTGVNYLQKLY